MIYYSCEEEENREEDCVDLTSITPVIRMGTFLACVNSCLNFFIYYLNGKRFRDAAATDLAEVSGCFSGCCGKCRSDSTTARPFYPVAKV